MWLIKRGLRIKSDSNTTTVITAKLIILYTYKTSQPIICIRPRDIWYGLFSFIYQTNTVDAAISRFDMKRGIFPKSRKWFP